jgi:hypothetical protein
MTQEEVCKFLEEIGFVRYKNTFASKGSISLEGPTVGSSLCECNHKKRPLHAEVCSGFDGHEGTVSFYVFGSVDGIWLRAEMYSIARYDVEGKIEAIQDAAGAMWEAFCDLINDKR